MAYSDLGIRSIEMGTKALIGYGVGVLAHTNAKLWALVLATQTVVHVVLNSIFQRVFEKSFRAKTIADCSEFLSYTSAIVALQYFGLIALTTSGFLGFLAFGYLLANRASKVPSFPKSF